MARSSTSPARPTPAPPTGPVRTCIGCRRRTTKDQLVRVTAGSDADGRPVVRPDPDGAAPGRGAHLHPTTECLDLAVRRKAFGRALRIGAGIDPEPLAQHLETRHPQDQHRAAAAQRTDR